MVIATNCRRLALIILAAVMLLLAFVGFCEFRMPSLIDFASPDFLGYKSFNDELVLWLQCCQFSECNVLCIRKLLLLLIHVYFSFILVLISVV